MTQYTKELRIGLYLAQFLVKVMDKKGNELYRTSIQEAAESLLGCAGLNPAAYRECVEALKAIFNLLEQGQANTITLEHDGKYIKQAIAHAEATR